MRPKVIVTGVSGQLGMEVWKRLEAVAEVFPFSGPSGKGGAPVLDICDRGRVSAIIKEISPNFIVNAAAYTAVDRAENDKKAAYAVNSAAPGIIGEAAEACGASVVHFSTDYVFGGAGIDPHAEDDNTSPINVYGHSKMLGEAALLSACKSSLVVRTSWVYGKYGNNFVNTMLRLGAEKKSLSVVGDQFGSPTSTVTLADFVYLLVTSGSMLPEAYIGVLHLTDSGYTSWFEFAKKIFESANRHGIKLMVEEVNKCSSEEFKSAAERPKNSRLSMSKLQSLCDFAPPTWQEALERYVSTSQL